MDELWNALDSLAKDRKERAAAMREGVDPALEKAQDVVAAFSRELYERFAGDGFTYAASKRTIKRIVGDWTQEIVLDGHGGNTRGRRIHFSVWALVKNTPWKKWRKSVPSAFYLGENPEIVSSPARTIPGWPKETWDLHQQANRPRIMDEAEELIRAKLIPVLDLFTDRDALRRQITSDDRRWSDRLVMLDTGIDLLLYYFDGPAAAELVDRFVEQHGDEQQITAALAKVRSGWRANGRSSESETVALAMELYKLPVRHPMLAKLRRSELPEVDPKARPEPDSGELLRDQLRSAGFAVESTPTPTDSQRQAFAQQRAAELRREMNDASLSAAKRNTAAHWACAMLEQAGPDEPVWELLAERLKLGLCNRRSVMWPATVELVKRLKARSAPPKGCEHVPDAYLR